VDLELECEGCRNRSAALEFRRQKIVELQKQLQRSEHLREMLERQKKHNELLTGTLSDVRERLRQVQRACSKLLKEKRGVAP
jgi:DNA repair exonuclease SbcCD ATPase subunit